MEKIKEAIEAIKKGEFVIVLDDEKRENEGDLVIAGEKITPEKLNFMISEAKGLICFSISQKDARRLLLPQMVKENQDNKNTRFTVSVDAKEVDTGISAYERSLTIKKLSDPSCSAEDFRRPGHIFPIEVNENGLLGRGGHTEASYELIKLAGLKPGAAFCEIIRSDGAMAREKDLLDFSYKHQIKFLKIADIVEYLQSKNNV